MIWFRHSDPNFPFLWEDGEQPAARWHADGDGPAHYFADTSDGAWAEFIRHEEIKDPDDLVGVRRAIWAVEVRDEPSESVALPKATLLGGQPSYSACQAEAKRLRDVHGVKRILVPSAALLPGGAAGHLVDGGLRAAPARDGVVTVLFGRRPDLIGWAAAHEGRPREDLLKNVRHF